MKRLLGKKIATAIKLRLRATRQPGSSSFPNPPRVCFKEGSTLNPADPSNATDPRYPKYSNHCLIMVTKNSDCTLQHFSPTTFTRLNQ